VTAQYAYFGATAPWRGIGRAQQGICRARCRRRCCPYRRIPAHPAQLPAPLIVVATVQIANSISLQATLSFLGLGLPPTEPSARHADRQWLPVHALRPLLDLDLSRYRAHRPDRRHQPVGDQVGINSTRGSSDERAARGPRPDHAFHDPRRRRAGGRGRVIRRDGGRKSSGIVGESGSGKSVTGLSILGLIDAPGRSWPARSSSRAGNSSGSDHAALRTLRGRRVAMCSRTDEHANPVLTIATQMRLALAAMSACRTRRRARDRSRRSLPCAFPSRERLDAYPHQFSAACATPSPLPSRCLQTAGADHLRRADDGAGRIDPGQILTEMRAWCANLGTALIWISHDSRRCLARAPHPGE